MLSILTETHFDKKLSYKEYFKLCFRFMYAWEEERVGFFSLIEKKLIVKHNEKLLQYFPNQIF